MLSKEQKVNEAEKLYEVMRDNYPFFKVKQRQESIFWLANKQHYKERIIKTKDDIEYYYELKSVISELRDSHLSIVSPQYIIGLKNMYQSIGYRVWTDKLAAALPDYKYWIGLIPAQSTDYSGDEAIHEIKEYDNGHTIYLKIPRFKLQKQACKDIRRYLIKQELATKVIIDIRGNQGGNAAQWMNYIVPPLIRKPLAAKFVFAVRGGSLIDDYIPSVHISSKDLLQPIETLPHGFDYPPELFIDFHSYFTVNYRIEPYPNNFKGQVYLLVDKGVYSSAESLAAWSKATGFAIITGERTKGDGIGFDPVFYQLPHSRLLLSLPLVLGLSSDGNANVEWGTRPDIECEASKSLEILLSGKS